MLGRRHMARTVDDVTATTWVPPSCGRRGDVYPFGLDTPQLGWHEKDVHPLRVFAPRDTHHADISIQVDTEPCG